MTKNVCLYGWCTLTDQNSTSVKGLQNHTYSQVFIKDKLRETVVSMLSDIHFLFRLTFDKRSQRRQNMVIHTCFVWFKEYAYALILKTVGFKLEI